MPVRDSVVRETEWFAVYPRLVTLVGNDGTSPEAFRRTLDAAAARGVVGLVDFEFGGSREDWAERWAEGCDLLRDPVGDLRRHPRRRDRRRPAHRRPAARLRRPRHDGAAQDHQRRLAQHPHRLVLRAVRRRAPPRVPRRPAQPLRRRAPRPARRAPTAAASRSPPTRSATRRSPRRSRRTPTPGAWARSSTPSWSRRDDVRRMAELGVRASVQPAHLLDDRDLTELVWPGRGRAVLRVPLDARRRRRAGARLRRPGLAARPVAGDGGRRAPQRRRPRPVARRAGAHPRRGAGRLGRRPADRRHRLTRRPGAARRRPARCGDARAADRRRRRCARPCRSR